MGLGPETPLPEIRCLDFKVEACSTYSSGYRPELVLENKPHDQASRWSSASNDQNQFLILRLCEPAIVSTIAFGKFHKNHVCNLKEFKVLVACSELFEECRWTEVLHSGLRNDSHPECFPLVYPAWRGTESVSFANVLHFIFNPHGLNNIYHDKFN